MLTSVFIRGLVLCGLIALCLGLYPRAKALFAQFLLDRSWHQTQIRTLSDSKDPSTLHDKNVKPWPWADTWPVAKLRFDRLDQELLVLAGSSGGSLAFGPGHLAQSPLPGEGGNSVIVGHRDTHFQSLRDLKELDQIAVTTVTRDVLRYIVTSRFVVHESELWVAADADQEELTLITCYPFDALRAGGPMRYVVKATLQRL